MVVRKLGNVAHMSIEEIRNLWGDFETVKDSYARSTSTNILCPEGHAITDKKKMGMCAYTI